MFFCVHVVVSGEESEEEEGEAEGGDRAEVTLKMKQALLEEEKQAVLQNKELLEEVHTAHVYITTLSTVSYLHVLETLARIEIQRFPKLK